MPAQEKSIPACSRCRKRKTRCDASRPLCGPCRRSGVSCLYFDSEAKTELPRQHICDLEETLRALELEHSTLINGSSFNSAPDTDTLAGTAAITASISNTADGHWHGSHTDLIDVGHARGEAHYVGSSSGLHIARAVLETAERNSSTLGGMDEHDSVAEIHESTTLNQSPVTTLPLQETAMELASVFFNQFQVQYPILEETTFMANISQIYGNRDPGVSTGSNFQQLFVLRLVLAISLHCLSKTTPAAGSLASNYSTIALKELPDILLRRDLQSLQCLLLVLLLSLLQQTQLPIWYISGMCTRLCINLGLHNEKSIKASTIEVLGEDSDQEVDCKRRLFWVTYIFDRTLGSVLGRPITILEDMIDVDYPVSTITQQRRGQTVHWLKLQRLRTEILQRLYGPEAASKLDVSETSDDMIFRAQMSEKLASWFRESTLLATQGPYDLHWWNYWRCNTLLFLHRPAMRNTRIDMVAYTTALEFIQLSFVRLHQENATLTWLDMQYQINAGTMLLFAIWSCSEVRERSKREWVMVRSCLVQWEQLLSASVQKWPRGSRAKGILVALKDSTVVHLEKELMGISVHEVSRHDLTRQKSYQAISQEALLTRDNNSLARSYDDPSATEADHVPYSSQWGLNPTIQASEFEVFNELTSQDAPDLEHASNGEFMNPQSLDRTDNDCGPAEPRISWNTSTAATQWADQAFGMIDGFDDGFFYQGATIFPGFNDHEQTYMESVLNFHTAYSD
ncbi:hypothetical protein LTR84_003807 [Exophiala bonariae]|uniref:Zn(2)-C6 fungal-type domain-containing protein n=1 Tax=Exophiala bonariae TaxID=1690606 RepID=A0AAV9N9X2_9EURO|nr:hypothetical protein LTR84_003807 [Exophiala bonariae]